MPVDSDERYRAPALDKGLDIIELLAGSESAMTQLEISQALSRTPNEFYRMLDRLVRRGYVKRGTDDRYELSLKLFALAHRHVPMRRLVSQARPIMEQLAFECSQACFIAVYDRGDLNSIFQVDPPGHWGVSVRVGAQMHISKAASGLVILAFVSENDRKRMLSEQKQSLGETIASDLEERLAEIRTLGYCLMPSRQIVGVNMLAAPIMGPGNTPIAALTIPQIDRLDAPNSSTSECLPLLLLAARDISALFGGIRHQV